MNGAPHICHTWVPPVQAVPSMRRNAWGVLLFIVLLAGCAQMAPAQTLVLTEAQHSTGDRALTITGLFHDADTVLVQIYHDSDVVHEEVCINTFSFTLGQYHHYVLKFTDAQLRVKRIYIVELSDNQLEWLPPIEIDFSTTGNVLYLKQRDGKLDFQEFDVGMSRKP